MGSLIVECPICDHKDKYIGISRNEIKKIKALLKTIKFGGQAIAGPMKIFLCPRCAKRLNQGKYVCENCGVKFKNKKNARILSICLPGGGYFYSRHIVLGVVNAILETALLTGLGLSIYSVIDGNKNSIVYIVVFALAFLFGKIISVYHSTRFFDEFIPVSKTIDILSRPKDTTPSHNISIQV